MRPQLNTLDGKDRFFPLDYHIQCHYSPRPSTSCWSDLRFPQASGRVRRLSSVIHRDATVFQTFSTHFSTHQLETARYDLSPGFAAALDFQ